MTGPFRSYSLADVVPFEELQRSAPLEPVGKGRLGGVLVKPDGHRGTPIVRTTSRYDSPAHCFTDLHTRLAEQIGAVASLSHKLNNALFEQYGNSYAKMGFHCDQALDLDPDSHIAVLSCYEQPPQADAVRKLVIESKATGEHFEIRLEQNSVVVFSVETNRQFHHKIVLDRSTNPPENQWLGLTFRTSKSYVQYGVNATFEDGTPLTLATSDEQKQFFQLRGDENREQNFVYPQLNYTISQSDLLRPLVVS